MEETPYEIAFSSFSAVCVQSSLCFPENAKSIRTKRPVFPIKTVSKAYRHASLKSQKSRVETITD